MDKLCIDCNFMIPSEISGDLQFVKCRHPTSTTVSKRDLVTGVQPDNEYRYCSNMRDEWAPHGVERCGPTGKFWEQAPPKPPTMTEILLKRRQDRRQNSLIRRSLAFLKTVFWR